MASGKLGSANLVAETYTTIYTVPVDKVGSLNILLVNLTESSASIRLAITTEATIPLYEDFIEYDSNLPARGIIERTAIIASPGEKIMVYSDTTNITVRIHGFEETI